MRGPDVHEQRRKRADSPDEFRSIRKLDAPRTCDCGSASVIWIYDKDETPLMCFVCATRESKKYRTTKGKSGKLLVNKHMIDVTNGLRRGKA